MRLTQNSAGAAAARTWEFSFGLSGRRCLGAWVKVRGVVTGAVVSGTLPLWDSRPLLLFLPLSWAVISLKQMPAKLSDKCSQFPRRLSFVTVWLPAPGHHLH